MATVGWCPQNCVFQPGERSKELHSSGSTGKVWSDCEQFFLLVHGEVIRSQHHQLSGFNYLGSALLISSLQLPSPTWWGFHCLQNSSLLCISLEGEPGACPKAAFSLVIPSLPGLATVCTCLLELREGPGGWMKPISCHHEMGDTERILHPGASQCPAVFQSWVAQKLEAMFTQRKTSAFKYFCPRPQLSLETTHTHTPLPIYLVFRIAKCHPLIIHFTKDFQGQ